MSHHGGPEGDVLVCHPDGSMRAAYERTLTDHGFHVVTTGTPDGLPDRSTSAVRAVVLSQETAGLSVADLHGSLEGTHARVALLVPFDAEPPAIERLPDRVDECLSAPVSDERLIAAVEALLARARYDARLRRCFELARRVAEAEADPDTDPSEVAELRDRLRRSRAELGESGDDIGALDHFAVAAEPDA